MANQCRITYKTYNSLIISLVSMPLCFDGLYFIVQSNIATGPVGGQVNMNTERDEELTALWEISPRGLGRTNSREKFPLKNYGYPLTLSNLWSSV